MKKSTLLSALLLLVINLHAQSPLHLNGYDLFCMIEKKGNDIVVNNFSDHILDQHYPIIPITGSSLWQLKDSSRRQEFLDNIGLNSTILESNQFYSTAKYDFYDSVHHRSLSNVTDKIINRLHSTELNGRMVLMGPRATDTLDDDLSDTGNQKKLVKSENGFLTYLLLGLVLLLAAIIAYLFYDRKKRVTPILNENDTETAPQFPESSEGISTDAKKLFSKIEDAKLKKEFTQFFTEVKQELITQQTQFSQTEQKLTTELQTVKKDQAQLSELMLQDKRFATAAFDKLAKPLLDYFETHQNYPLDENGRKLLISHLLKLSFHMMSYLNVKRAAADQFDRSNMDEILGLPVSDAILKNTSTKPVYGDVPLFVHHICDLMLANGLEDLEGVNIKSYKISSKA
ncbi:MAG TPA: hypothetical protein PLU10_02080 [Chitinophagaceae bacterium]|nr:hypothetical protein [Chitinophagaceae bacterium]